MYPIGYNYPMTVKKLKVYIYKDERENEPFTNWLRTLDPVNRARILKRIERFELGGFGDHKALKGLPSIFEARFFFGTGYRVYFGKDGAKVILLLFGGDKKSQKKDTSIAKGYWRNYCKKKESES